MITLDNYTRQGIEWVEQGGDWLSWKNNWEQMLREEEEREKEKKLLHKTLIENLDIGEAIKINAICSCGDYYKNCPCDKTLKDNYKNKYMLIAWKKRWQRAKEENNQDILEIAKEEIKHLKEILK